MRTNVTRTLILLGIFFLVGFCAWKIYAAKQGESPGRMQWEYLLVEVPEYGWEAEMNKLGAEGWELVHIRRVVETFGLRFRTLLERGIMPDIKYQYIFKRLR